MIGPAPGEQKTLEAHQRGLRILLFGGQAGFAAALAEDGHDVIAATTATGALASARAVLHDVVILDLANAASYALAKEVRAVSYWKKPMFVALGDQADKEADARCRENSIDLLVFEPYRSVLQGFLARLRAIVEDYESFDPMI